MNNATISIKLESVNVASYQTSINRWQKILHLYFNLISHLSHNISISLLIPNEYVQLWWPNRYGDQSLYTLSVYNQGELVGSRLIGFRTVELAQHSYGSTINGTSFYFIINGHPIYIKGSNWVPPDSFQERVTDEKLERLLRSTQLANMNMLRVWGGGLYERDSFYEIADRLGIMLWHDFMFACSLYPIDELFLINIHKEVIYQVKRLQSHPSIVLW
ncbi:unnamed protein product [Rotaria sp. Silwood2]|nr:unnamed protein product [Rotaria sp. Silwood2]CAF2792563.1 unnamed protein product [Rotaria sp. Silwood2]CAF3232295.1 unnamed protein product [Rotaria sp. Silwood2]